MSQLAYTHRCARRGVLMMNDNVCQKRKKRRPGHDTPTDIRYELADCRACEGPEVLAEPIPIDIDIPPLAEADFGKPGCGTRPGEPEPVSAASNRRRDMPNETPKCKNHPDRAAYRGNLKHPDRAAHLRNDGQNIGRLLRCLKKVAAAIRSARSTRPNISQMLPFVLVLRSRAAALRWALDRADKIATHDKADDLLVALDFMAEAGFLPGWKKTNA